MTIVYDAQRHHYTGLSGDSKPVSGVQDGASFYETDTTKNFDFQAYAARWLLRPPLVSTRAALAAASVPSAANPIATVADITVFASEPGFYGSAAVKAAARPAIPTQMTTVSVSDFNALRDHLIALGLVLDGD